MVEAGDVWDWEESIWTLETEEAMSTTTQAPILVQELAPFEVQVAAPRPQLTVYKTSSPIQYDTHAQIQAPVVDLEDQGIWKKVQAKEYSVIEQLTKTPSQMSILAILQSSETHRNVLLNILGEAYVPSNITYGEVFEAYKISFNNDELPLEGTTHNKALYISVQYQDKVINKALVDVVELVGNIELQPWFSQKIIDMMAWFGFELGKGLGAELQGIVEPIQPYTTEEWLDWQPPRDGYYYPLKKPIPPLHQSFRSTGFMGGIIDEISEDLKGLSLTKEEAKVCNVVINKEEKGGPSGSKEAKIRVSNWTSTPSRPCQASRYKSSCTDKFQTELQQQATTTLSNSGEA
uniref:G-patch domain-containing protein n=1 Tax=Solanum lycopersicum TaxID=4081 RepID=A0A3Q7JXA6_SOLLC